MVALPYCKVCCNSLLRCPSCVWVSWARAWIWWEESTGWWKLFAWILTVRLSRLVRSGSCAAIARRSIWGRAGTAGGTNCPSYTTELSTDTSAPQSISSLYCVSISSLLRILICTIKQKISNTKIYFVSPIFYTVKKFHAQLCQYVHTQTPKHSTGLGI